MSLNWIISLIKNMAEKKVATPVAEKVTEKTPVSVQKTMAVAVFYANKSKVERAELLVANGEYKTLKEAYLSLGGLLTEGQGYKEV